MRVAMMLAFASGLLPAPIQAQVTRGMKGLHKAT